LIIIVQQLAINELLRIFKEVLRYVEDRDITNAAIEVTIAQGVPVIDEYPLPE
jgi:hypothetical protein